MRLPTRIVGLFVLASCLVHVALMAALLRLPPGTVARRAFEQPLDLEEGRRGTLRPGASARRGAHERPRPGGPRSPQNIDAPRAGGEGDLRGAEVVIGLLPRADGVTLQDSPMTAVGVAQTQRSKTGERRESHERRRAIVDPSEVPFLATGPGQQREQRRPSRHEAQQGVGVRLSPSVQGAAARRRASSTPVPSRGLTRAASTRPADELALGGPRAAPRPGVIGGRGVRPSLRTRLATGRPPVDPGPTATLAPRAERSEDRAAAELLAARLVQSSVEATRQRGTIVGLGRGGVGGEGPAGVGRDRVAGGHASRHSPGPGHYAALDTSDPRYRRWHARLRGMVHDRLRFPRERALAMDQGSSVYQFIVRSDGRLLGRPEPVRSSGYDDFDSAARAAIVQAAPFPPLPRELATDGGGHAVIMRIDHSNPMVR